ncbi:ATP-binding protein [Paenibacillus chibensis]|uniref:hybrid sensor histidine kinase/response regulator n=3 Tax=Paenibacillus chibensis TaxID=59846 RepID=UPI000FD91592
MSKSTSMMATKKIWIIATVFLTVLTGFRLLWLQYHSTTHSPVAVRGVLDLRGWSPISERSLHLSGEWEFDPGVLLFPNAASSGPAAPSQTIQVPGSWTLGDGRYSSDKYGFGTYRLRILVDPGKGKSYGIHIPSIRSASELYVNGQLLGHSGQPGISKEQYKPLNVPYTVTFTPGDTNEIDLVIQVSNFDDSRDGGIDRSISFGLENILSKDMRFSENMVWIACVVYAIHVVYGLLVYLVGDRDKRLIFYSLMIVCVILATLMDGERLLYAWIPFSFVWSLKSVYIAMLAGGYFLHQLIKNRLPFMLRGWKSLAYELLSMLAVLSVLLLPLSSVLAWQPVYLALMFIPCLFTIVAMFRMTASLDVNNLFLLLAAIAAISSLIWLIMINVVHIDMISYPFDLIIAMICFSVYWFRRFFRLSWESRQLTESLRLADRQKDDFLSTVAHELRNPLHGMINISQSLSDREQAQPGVKSSRELQLLIQVGRRMSYMLNDLLDMARLKENRVRLNLERVSLHGAASSVIDMLRYMTEGKPIQLVNRIPEGFPPVEADENRLNQILFNLLHNAIKYSNAGEVTVQAEIQDGLANLSVADTGIGIDEDLQEHIFEPYAQGSSACSSFRGGFGLGLSICKQLIEMHGGTLIVRSKPSEGSVFSFTLRLAADGNADVPAETSAETAVARAEGSEAPDVLMPSYGETISHASYDQIRLLAVDDDPVNLNVLRTIFANEDYDVFTATSGMEALKQLEYGGFDLIVTDVAMPGMSGYELTRLIRERYSLAELPVLLLTAYHLDKDIEAGFRSGANDYVTKPVNATELKARVRSLTNLKQSVNERLRMEAALLQSQIKPHFLINTFNAVSALSRVNPDKMDDLIEELTNYFRLGIDFDHFERSVPLEHELNLIRSYLFIQKERFEDRIRMVWEVDEGVNIRIPPLTIQPLVENAVSHGILKRGEGGEVRIRIADLGRSVEICVSDNGVGMDEEKVRQILNTTPGIRSGTGLINTHRRLKQFCGSELRIESVRGSGTRVSFTIVKHQP